MKKILSAMLAATVAAGSAVPVFAADTFTDVNEKSYAWAYEYVEEMAKDGLIKGYEDGTFRPGNSVSRMEAFALFARLMGSNKDTNAEVLEAAKDKYAKVLDEYDLSYAEGDIAYMLSRGVITESELNTYFGGTRKSEAMPRYEAAVLITKAMNGETEAKDEVLVDMDYTDVAAIPKNAKQYVYYVTKKGIMSGMGDGAFSPDTSVLRGQIAVMLSRTADSMNYSFEKASLVNADTASNKLEIKYSDGSKQTIGYNENTKFLRNGEEASAESLAAGQTLALTYTGDDSTSQLAFVDIFAVEIDNTKAAVFQGYASQGGKLTVSLLEPETGNVKAYECSENAAVTADGVLSDINKLKNGDYVTVGFSGSVIASIDAMQKSTTVKGVIEAINPAGTITISSDDKEFDGITLSMTNDIRILKNGDNAEFASLYKGDTVTITLDYGLASKIIASSATKTVSGTLKSYTVSSTPSIVIKKDGEEFTYDLTAGVEIYINGESAKLADFEIGSSVVLTLESDAVKKVESSKNGGTLSSSKLTGVVTGVNAAAKVIVIECMDGSSAYITCTATTKYYVVPTLSEYALKSIKVGDTIDAYGSYSNGIFVSTGINVTPSAE
ncbi:MAG: S-layer homology domain-containing protein [Clostridiales bacterium]|nr:S-layer homology domain-containing protein [Clostridiales bacterium]